MYLFMYLFTCTVGDPHHWLNLEVTYQTQKTVFEHNSKHQDRRRELKMQRLMEYF